MESKNRKGEKKEGSDGPYDMQKNQDGNKGRGMIKLQDSSFFCPKMERLKGIVNNFNEYLNYIEFLIIVPFPICPLTKYFSFPITFTQTC